MVVIRIPAKRCYGDGVKEPEAVQGPERKKQKRVEVMGLRASSSLEKQRLEAAMDNLKQERVDVMGLRASSSLEKQRPEAAMDILKQERVDVMGLRAPSSLEKRRPEAAMDNLKRTKPSATRRAADGLKRKRQSGTFTGRSVQTRPLRKASEDVVHELRPETVARVVISPSNNEITSLTRSAKVCISDREFKSVCKNWRRLKIQRQREEARRKIDSMTCTAGFSDNLDAVREFEMLLGVRAQWSSMLYS